jgi:hypothetical protein
MGDHPIVDVPSTPVGDAVPGRRIEVRIGRIEVHPDPTPATAPTPTATSRPVQAARPTPAAPRRPAVSLEAYLARRGGRPNATEDR